MFPVSDSYALFDDNLAQGESLLLTGLIETLRYGPDDDLQAVFERIEAATQAGQWVAIAATYELGQALEPRLAGGRVRNGPAACLLTAWVFGSAERLAPAQVDERLNDTLAQLESGDESAALGGVAGLEIDPGFERYHRDVTEILGLITEGDCYQVNYTVEMRGDLFGHPLTLYQRLRERQPVRYGVFIQHPDGWVLSRSPELFVQRQGDTLTCKPMKGTAAIDSDPMELHRSEKNRAENLMIVDLIRNDLGRLAPPGGVRVASLFELEAYPSLWQMISTVTASPVTADLLTIVRALFPCGSITGAPKIRAMEIIAQLESRARGIYCGALGWVAPGGDFRFNVPIRTLEIDPRRRVRLGIGSGIVADSDPTQEWAETLLKARFLTGLEPAFGLIETLRGEPDASLPYPLLALHLARLQASARYFGIAIDLDDIRHRLQDAARRFTGTHRVRLFVSPDGTPEIITTTLDPLSPSRPSIVLSPQRVRSDDPLLRHKTSFRSLYDLELARVSALGHFDALFLNERDELAEGARSNLFLDFGDGILHTPALSCGALDGVYRRKLIQSGEAQETILTLEDLANARRIYVANALRGLIEVDLAVA